LFTLFIFIIYETIFDDHQRNFQDRKNSIDISATVFTCYIYFTCTYIKYRGMLVFFTF